MLIFVLFSILCLFFLSLYRNFVPFTMKSMSKKYTTVIFDLDGTLMDTLADLAASTNYALAQMGFQTRSVDEVRNFVGNGVRKLIERAVPADTTENQLNEVFAHFRTHYAAHCKDNSAPYAGIPGVLAQLQKQGFKMAIVSNKPDAEVKQLNSQFFADSIRVAMGENEQAGIPKKPSPEMVAEAMRLLGSAQHECLYVGDSDVDILTAQNAGIDCLSVTWGFRSAEFLTRHGALHFVDQPSQLLDFLK